MRHGFAGRWWRFVPRGQWPQDQQSTAAILKHWTAECGDCRQELVFIGQHLDVERLHAALNACLLTDAEMALGAEQWSTLPDPFGDWHDEEAA